MGKPAKRASKGAAKGAKTLAQRIVAAPQLSAPKDAKAKFTEWLAGPGRSELGKTLARLFKQQPKAAGLIAALADGSPYLWDLASADPARLAALLNADPDTRLAALLKAAARAVAATRDEARAMTALRRMK